MRFSQVIGHTKHKEILRRGVATGRISHSQLFVGQAGAGNLPLALAYAQYLMCPNKKDGDACGECPSCKKVSKGIHPDVHYVFPVARVKKSARPISDSYIGEWRKFLGENPYGNLNDWLGYLGTENQQAGIFAEESQEIYRKLSMKTYEGSYKIMLIWFAEKMNLSAANKLLKILEEPTENTVFLLIAESTERMLPTILSRTQMLKMPRIGQEELAAALVQRHQADKQQATDLARSASGNYRQALELMSQSEKQKENFEQFSTWMRLCYSRKVEGAMQWSEQMASYGREQQKDFFIYALGMVRENAMLHLNGGQDSRINHMSKAEAQFSGKFFHFIHPNNMFAIASELEKAHYHIERNGYAKLIFLDLSLKMLKLLRTTKP